MAPDRSTLEELRIDRSAVPRRQSRGLLFLPLLVLIVLAAGTVWWFVRPKPVLVRTAVAREVKANGQRTLLNASGYVTARREATVSSKVTGKVIEVLIEEGMRVTAGQILARLDDSNVEASLRLADARHQAARAALAETTVRLHEAELELNRVSQLAEEGIASSSDLDSADAEVGSLKARLAKQSADVTVAQREVALWQQEKEDTIVRAPFDGVVTAKNAQPGEMISPISAGGGFTRTGICTIVDMNSLEIEVDVNESYINRVKPGQRVEATLDSYPDWRIPAEVIAIIPTADRQKATVKVRVGLDELDSRILPHMGVKVAFQSTEEDGGDSVSSVVVPKSAVREQDGGDVVWVVADGTLERRAVTVRMAGTDEVVLAAGLRPGERVVLEGPPQLAEGIRIREVQP
jgi:RND family efflux transporter MFP subunit